MSTYDHASTTEGGDVGGQGAGQAGFGSGGFGGGFGVSSDIAAMRQEYGHGDLDEGDFAPNWLDQFRQWLAEAGKARLAEPNAMVLATADDRGRPSARTVLLKDVDERGFVFFTNYGSRKGIELLANPYASLVFGWHAIGRQVVVCGGVHKVDREQTERYFASRPLPAQLGAWASQQSQVVADRATLDAALAQTAQRFSGQPVPAPEHWGGFRVVPQTVEFWQGRLGRLHDRLRYRDTGSGWLLERLAP